MIYVVLKGYLYDSIDYVKFTVATELEKVNINELSTLTSILMNYPFHKGKSLSARQVIKYKW